MKEPELERFENESFESLDELNFRKQSNNSFVEFYTVHRKSIHSSFYLSNIIT